jgi:hypothetical protein
MIRAWLEAHPNARLVVIDVYNKVRPEARQQDSVYASDYRALEPVNALADEFAVAILILHHTRKLSAEDPFDTVSGSTGFTGAADAVLVLAHDSQGTTLYGRGRDIEEIETAVRFDPVLGSWSILGAAREVRRSDERTEILKALREAGEPMSPRDIADVTGKSHDAVRQTLVRMWRASEVTKAKRGSYAACQPIDPRHNGHNVTKGQGMGAS